MGALLLRYGIYAPDLPHSCNGCSTRSSVTQDLYYQKGSLFATCHNKFCGGVAYLDRNTFIPLHVENNPLIHTVCVMRGVNTQLYCSPSCNNPPQRQWDSVQKDNFLI